MGEYLLAIDQGTTSTRAILFENSGQILGTRQLELPQIFPKPGWVEHDAELITTHVIETVKGVMADRELSSGDIAAIGITNQRE
ncbi:MAG TPA: glycerol kinase, partial [Rhodospirillaceae bacterium]|nr:glycerol kinase [Rhodospirillaceae bacterium]